MSKSLISLFFVFLVGMKSFCQESLDFDLRIVNTSNSLTLPQIELRITNQTAKKISIPMLGDTPIVFVDYWCDDEGIVLIKSDHYEVMIEGFRVIHTIEIESGCSESYTLNTDEFVAYSGENMGDLEWQNQHFDYNEVRIAVCIRLDDRDLCSNMLRIYGVEISEPNKPTNCTLCAKR